MAISHLGSASLRHLSRPLLLAACCCGSLALAQAPPAPPSGSGAESGALEEVVVTASRRSEDVQKAPVAVDAVTADDLERAGVQNFADLQKITPNLTVQQAPGGFNFINIRGVGVGVATPFQSAGVPLMVDGMYLPHSENYILTEYFDMDHVEVYRGPQGTFAGQNSTGGAIFVYATQPKIGAFDGFVQQLVGDYHWYQTQAAVNLPISDQWAARIAVNAEKRDGFTTNLGAEGPTGIPQGQDAFFSPGNLDRLDLRAIVRYTPSDSLDFRLRYDNIDERDNGPADIPDGNSAAFYTPGGGAYQGTFNSSKYITNPYTVSYDYPQDRVLRTNRAILNIDWHINSGVELKSISGYQYYLYVTDQDGDYGSPFPGALNYTGPIQTSIHNSTRDTYYTQEIDLVSTTDSPLQWVAGADAYKQITPIHTTVDVYAYGPQPGPPFPIPGLTAPPYGPDSPFGGIILNYYQQDKSYAGFGELRYNVTDRFQVIAGGRWTYYEIGVDPPSDITTPTTPFAVVPSCLAGPGPTGPGYPPPYSGPTGTGGLCNISARAPYSEPTGRLVLSYLLAPESTLYASASHGFKQGGYVTQFDEGPGEHPGYKPERINAYELGIKTTNLDRHVRVNADLFWEDYRNYQTPFSVPSGAVPLTLNTDDAHLYGAELSFDTAFEGLKTTINAGYTQSRIEKDTTPAYVQPGYFGPYDPVPASAFTCTLLGITTPRCMTFTGEGMIYSPKFTANAALSYDFHVPGGGVVTPYLQYWYVDSQWATLFHASQDFIPSSRNLDLRVAYQSAGHWRLEAFVLNVVNRVNILGVAAGPSAAPYLGAVLIGNPRQVGGRVLYSF
jgi:iron complex outermembrane recepter protein